MKYVVILGASGFIGSALCRALASKPEFHIIAVHRKAICCPVANIDYEKVGSYEDYIPPANSICLHFAGENMATKEDPENQVLNAAIRLAKSILNCRHYESIVYFSSAAVYGDKVDSSRSEDELIEPSSEYGRTKLAQEKIFLADKRSTVIRLANVYGPKMSKASVFFDIAEQLACKTMTVFNLTSVRDYLHIDDTVQGILKILKSPKPGVYNLSSGTPTSVKKLIETVYSARALPCATLVESMPIDHLSTLFLDPKNFSADFDWSATIPLEKGVKSIVEYWK